MVWFFFLAALQVLKQILSEGPWYPQTPVGPPWQEWILPCLLYGHATHPPKHSSFALLPHQCHLLKMRVRKAFGVG